MAAVRCDHCGALIQDPSTSVNYGGHVYCCANCSEAVEQQGSGNKQNWDLAFENGYEEGFKKTHPQ